MDWITPSAITTAVATGTYTLLFAFAVHIAYSQWKSQETLTIFKELQAKDLVDARRYIYENFPESLIGLEDNQIKDHFHKAEAAFLAYDRIGYLLYEDHVDEEHIMENYWSSIWRCWQRGKDLIELARKRRGEPDYLDNFEYLFELAEDYRVRNEYEEPKFWITRIIRK